MASRLIKRRFFVYNFCTRTYYYDVSFSEHKYSVFGVEAFVTKGDLYKFCVAKLPGRSY